MIESLHCALLKSTRLIENYERHRPIDLLGQFRTRDPGEFCTLQSVRRRMILKADRQHDINLLFLKRAETSQTALHFHFKSNTGMGLRQVFEYTGENFLSKVLRCSDPQAARNRTLPNCR